MSIPFYAKRFVAGETLPEALQVVSHLNSQNLFVTLDILGENVRDEQKAREALTAYQDVAKTAKAQGLDTHISIKLTMLGLDISTALAEELLTRLMETADETKTFIRIDMEGSPYTQRTLDVFLKVSQRYPLLGIVLQAYLHRTPEDLEAVLKAKRRVRLVKGAYKEPANLAIQNMPDIRERFLALAERLLQEGEYPAFGTHDDFLIKAVKEYCDDHKISQHRYEFQMLYGLRRQTWLDLRREGYNMRVYVPFGKDWYPYFSRRLRERKENVFFVLRNMFRN